MTTKRAAPRPQTKGLTLGLEGFAWISAVEGIKLSQESLEMFAEFDRLGLSNEERRKFISRSIKQLPMRMKRSARRKPDPHSRSCCNSPFRKGVCSA